MFINFSNHRSDGWCEEQVAEAKKYGDIKDVSFPIVDAEFDEVQVSNLAEEQVRVIKSYNPTVVMVQGEFTLTYAIVERLKKLNIKCIAACSKRKTIETVEASGETKKESVFKFVRFREF